MNFTFEYSKRKREFEEYLKSFIADFDCPKQLADAMAYSLLSGGKRLRPVLFFESVRMTGKKITQSSVDFALAIECIHTYSLIHDDLPCMDNDDLRRGQPTCHKKFGESTAVLAGDALLNAAYELILRAVESSGNDSGYVKAANILARAASGNGLIGGQICDLSQDVSPQSIDYIYLNKTAALIKASLLAGAVIGNASEQTIRNIGIFGDLFGYCFQLQDDLLDKEQDDAKTYISIYGEEKTEAVLKEKTAQALEVLRGMENSEFLYKLTESFTERKE